MWEIFLQSFKNFLGKEEKKLCAYTLELEFQEFSTLKREDVYLNPWAWVSRIVKVDKRRSRSTSNKQSGSEGPVGMLLIMLPCCQKQAAFGSSYFFLATELSHLICVARKASPPSPPWNSSITANKKKQRAIKKNCVITSTKISAFLFFWDLHLLVQNPFYCIIKIWPTKETIQHKLKPNGMGGRRTRRSDWNPSNKFQYYRKKNEEEKKENQLKSKQQMEAEQRLWWCSPDCKREEKNILDHGVRDNQSANMATTIVPTAAMGFNMEDCCTADWGALEDIPIAPPKKQPKETMSLTIQAPIFPLSPRHPPPPSLSLSNLSLLFSSFINIFETQEDSSLANWHPSLEIHHLSFKP